MLFPDSFTQTAPSPGPLPSPPASPSLSSSSQCSAESGSFWKDHRNTLCRLEVGTCSFNTGVVQTDLRRSSLHFAISSGVSSLILLAPGTWFCRQDVKKLRREQRDTLRTLRPGGTCSTYVFPVDADDFFMSHEAAVGHGTL